MTTGWLYFDEQVPRWLVRDNLRGQAYNMKANMQALNAVRPARAATLRSSASRSGKSRQLRGAGAGGQLQAKVLTLSTRFARAATDAKRFVLH